MSSPALELRAAGEQDLMRVYAWANEPLARAMSFSSEPIPLETHGRWFRAKLRDPDCLFYVAELADGAEPPGRVPVGLVRFDRESGAAAATISVSIAAEQRGRGLAAQLIALGCRQARAAHEGLVVHAYIRPDNAASIRAFERAGFRSQPDVEYRGTRAKHYVW